MNQQQCLKAIAGGQTALELLEEADPEFVKRFQRIAKGMLKYLQDAKSHFPDASYYTASGGFHLLLGSSHDDSKYGRAQRQLEALSADCDLQISDGDW